MSSLATGAAITFLLGEDEITSRSFTETTFVLNEVTGMQEAQTITQCCRSERQFFSRQRLTSLAGFGAVWLWSLIDAPISAKNINRKYHLRMEVQPVIIPNSLEGGTLGAAIQVAF